MGCTQSNVLVKENHGLLRADYVLGAKLGEGAFGQVRKAKAKHGGETVAIKIVDVRVRDSKGADLRMPNPDSKLLKYARIEAQLSQKLGNHPNCIKFYDCYLNDQLFYIVLELCSGSLMDKLVKSEQVSRKDLIDAFTQMLKGIAHSHSVGIAHRDVKPDNFLYGVKDTATVLKLCDFGLAAEIPAKGGLREVCGTAPYMSPEMLNNLSYDGKTDVWSFGVVAYLMFYGKYPYMPSIADPKEMKKLIKKGEPPIEFGSDSPGAFLSTILNRNAEQRLTAVDALQLPFLGKKKVVIDDMSPKAEVSLQPVLRKARTLTVEFKRKPNPIVNTDIDALLQKLEDNSSKSFFSEADAEDEDDCTHMKSNNFEDRIIERMDKRHSTHSGVISNKSGVISNKSTKSVLDAI
eukprot:TRINITY_DN53967_c0_g1_i1.p1 TRINITY_DN53967_c0_g1~~TRINITY_DN53967_c0_g1_i1.p1  ORF type:complete len:405 (-),score=84.84 TRINITY_DN53967_c0_g1_i1:484-1698(-)